MRLLSKDIWKLSKDIWKLRTPSFVNGLLTPLGLNRLITPSISPPFIGGEQPRFRGAETHEHLLERKKKMWGVSTKMRVLNVKFDKWGFGLKTSKSSKKRA